MYVQCNEIKRACNFPSHQVLRGSREGLGPLRDVCHDEEWHVKNSVSFLL